MFRRISKYFVAYFLKPYAKETTIHGVSLVAMPNLHLVERLFWVVMILLSATGASSLIISNWQRYIANPTVVSIQKDYRNWNNLLPSATGCFKRKHSQELLDKYVEETWGITINDTKYEYYSDFVKAVANTSYYSLNAFSKFESDRNLSSVNLLELAAKVHPKLTGTLVTYDSTHKTGWKLIMAEQGICFTVNNKFSNVLTFNVKGVEVIDADADETLLACHYLNGLCYARYDSDPQSPIDFFIHSYIEIADAIESRPHTLSESDELEVNYFMEETNPSPALRKLTPSQRKCRFDDEPITKDLSVYSPTMCYLACRYRMVLKFCGCRPFFYHFLGGKVCNISEMLCISKYIQEITKPSTELNCQCPQPCHTITYLPLPLKKATWTSGYFDQRITFRWGLLHPTTKYRRDILFSFEDLVGKSKLSIVVLGLSLLTIVSLGGSLSLFLGISFISLIEITYFLLNFLFHYFNSYSQKNHPPKRVSKVKIIRRSSTKSRRF